MKDWREMTWKVKLQSSSKGPFYCDLWVNSNKFLIMCLLWYDLAWSLSIGQFRIVGSTHKTL